MVSDISEDATLAMGAGAIVAAPFTGGSTLPFASVALQANLYSSIASTGFKTIDAVAYDGSPQAAINQGISTAGVGITGEITSRLAARFAVRTGPGVVGTLFRNPRTGEFVTNTYGRSVVTARDATNVGASVAIPEAVERLRPNEMFDLEE